MRPTTKRTTRNSGGLALAAPRTLGDLRNLFGGEVDAGARGIVVRALAPVEIAGEGDLAPVVASRFVEAARAGHASALLVSTELADRLPVGARWVHPHAMHALARALAALFTAAPNADGRALAHVDVRADVDETAIVGPGAVILAGARVAAGALIEPNAVVYGNVTVGARAIVGAGAVVGRPGFGWVASPDGALERVPQLGGVVIEDDAEIGALATVDAGTLGPTIIGRGAKLDAHVHVGHNAIIGAGAIVAAQSGLAGSVEIGDGVRVGGQAGFADHVRVGDGAQIAAKSGVIGDVAPGAVVAGYPAVDRARWLRAIARSLRDEGRPPPKRRRP